MSLDSLKRENKTHRELVDKALELEDRLEKAETIIAVLQRALGWVAYFNDENQVVLHNVLWEQGDITTVADATVTEDERRILERKEGGI